MVGKSSAQNFYETHQGVQELSSGNQSVTDGRTARRTYGQRLIKCPPPWASPRQGTKNICLIYQRNSSFLLRFRKEYGVALPLCPSVCLDSSVDTPTELGSI